MTFYSQHGEDRWILRNLQLPARGVFVEVGMGHSSVSSNSKAFEDLGWDGILVEPDPRTQPEIAAHRRARLFRCAAGAQDGRTSFVLDPSAPMLSGVLRTAGQRIDVPVRTLAGMLDEAGISAIDLLSIDTEGTELEVWNGLDAARRPSICIVEYSTVGLPEDPMRIIVRFLRDGYVLAHVTEGNLIFVKRQPDLGCRTEGSMRCALGFAGLRMTDGFQRMNERKADDAGVGNAPLDPAVQEQE